MSGLDRETRAFLEVSLDSDRPRSEDRARVRAKLAAQIGVPLGVDPKIPSASASASASTAAPTGLAATAAGGSGTLVMVALTSLVSLGAAFTFFGDRPETVAPASTALELVAPMPEPAIPAEASIPVPTEPMKPVLRSPRKSKGKTPSRPELAEEARLMAEVHLALRDERPERALALLEEYGSRFPRGNLRVERWAAQALASCALGRRDEAERSRERVSAMAPSSPLLLRIDAACGWARGSDE